MKTRLAAGAAVLGVLLAGCSSTSSGGSARSAGVPATSATTPADPGVTGPGAGGSAASSGSGSTSAPDAPSSATNASDKPVAALLAKVTPPIGGGVRLSSDTMPKAPAAWIAAVAQTDSSGKPLASDRGISVNLAALIDEAARTEDLDSLVKLCYLDCGQLPQLMPAKDPAGRTGFQRLSQLLEQTHPAPGHTQGASWDYPGFAAAGHGAASPIDQKDMKLLGTDAKSYSGLRTGFIMDDGKNPRVGWDAALSADG